MTIASNLSISIWLGASAHESLFLWGGGFIHENLQIWAISSALSALPYFVSDSSKTAFLIFVKLNIVESDDNLSTDCLWLTSDKYSPTRLSADISVSSRWMFTAAKQLRAKVVAKNKIYFISNILFRKFSGFRDNFMKGSNALVIYVCLLTCLYFHRNTFENFMC